MARLTDIVFDSKHPASLARFWAEAIDGYEVRHYDEAEIAGLADLGFTPETDPAVAIDGPGPTLFFQKSDLQKDRRNRIHIDLKAPNRAAESQRLVHLGATIRDEHDEYTVLLDPEGNELCIFDECGPGDA